MFKGKKILIVGVPGSGKSTFAKKLHNITNIPLYYLDNIFWNEDKTYLDDDSFDAKLNKILNSDKWIIDGLYLRTIERRISYCDTIIFLDYDLDTCLTGIKERVGKKRDDLPWVEDELNPEFEQYVIDSHKKGVSKIYELLNKYNDKEIVVFKTRNDSEDFLNNLK